jgi:16S rRNA (guanine527-N7)-methyltransferase
VISPEEFGRFLDLGAPAGDGVATPPGRRLLLERYLALVTQWSDRLRLTGVRTPEERARVLVLDALTLLPLLPARGKLIDLGSGAGSPGIPIAITQPQLHVVLVEASRKKAGFLQVVSRELALANVEVVNARAEALGRDPLHRERYDALTARALAHVRVLAEYALPLLRVGGVAAFPKGRDAVEEVASASRALALLGGEAGVQMPPLARFAVVVVRKVAPTPEVYPRRAGVPTRRPL